MKENIKIVNKLEENTGPFKLLDEGKPFLCDGKIYIKLAEPLSNDDGIIEFNAFSIEEKQNVKAESEQQIREVCISIYITK